MEPRLLVQKVLGEFFVSDRHYLCPLPRDLEPWHGYASDAGHSIICVLQSDYREEGDLTDFLCPVPVKRVLRDYAIRRGYVVVDCPYSAEFGLLTEPEDDEV